MPTLNWFPIDKNEFENVYDTGTPVVEVSLINMLEDVSEDIEERIYRNTEEWLIAQRDFYVHMDTAPVVGILIGILFVLCISTLSQSIRIVLQPQFLMTVMSRELRVPPYLKAVGWTDTFLNQVTWTT